MKWVVSGVTIYQNLEIKIWRSKSGDQNLEIKIWRSKSGDQNLEIKIWRSKSAKIMAHPQSRPFVQALDRFCTIGWNWRHVILCNKNSGGPRSFQSLATSGVHTLPHKDWRHGSEASVEIRGWGKRGAAFGSSAQIGMAMSLSPLIGDFDRRPREYRYPET
jgi:hypothetical protein